MTSLLEMSLTPRPRAPAEARKGLLTIVEKLPPDRFNDVRLLVSELVTNSVRHSGLNGGEGRQTIGFRVRQRGQSLRFEVSDPGKGPDRKVRASTEDQVSGWGLQIVDRLSERWGVVRATSGSTVWFEIDLE